MTIIRIEHPNGWGLWRTQIDGQYLIETASCHDALSDKHYNFPTPFHDEGLGKYDTNEFCAFKTIDSLQEWVEPEWMKEIISIGFKVLMIDVSTCRVGEYQILYKKENILQTKDITSLFI